MGPEVTYVSSGPRRWRMFMLGHYFGEVIRGQVSAYFRAPSGAGRLFSSVEDIDRRVGVVVRRYEEAAGALRTAVAG